jgi:putative membrane protein
MHVHQGNLAEIAVGKLAQAKGQTPLARTLGRVLQTDHAKGDTLVRAVAKARGISLTDALPADAQAELTKLQGLSGKAFDKELATFSMKDHAHEIALAEVESAKSPDATVRELAKKLLPTLKKHLALSEALNRRLGS